MVYCCVPQCGTDSWRCDSSITFHDFPHNPDIAAKWIQQINNAVKPPQMWFPRGKSVICSKHFLSTDFKDDSDSLKPRVVPTVFGYKYIGQNPEVEEIKSADDNTTGPLIVKIKTENDGGNNLLISGVYSQAHQLEQLINEPENNSPSSLQSFLTNSNRSYSYTNYQNNSKMGVKNQYWNSSTKSSNVITPNKLFSVQNKAIQKSKYVVKRTVQKRDNNDNNLIEIGPNTFLKINPDIIKVNRKLTPSGNTVLQFLMDQKLASTIGSDMLPKIVQGAVSTVADATTNIMKNKSPLNPSTNAVKNTLKAQDTEHSVKDTVVQHVLGHLVDTHVCKESCSKLQDIDEILMETDDSREDSDHNSVLNGDNFRKDGEKIGTFSGNQQLNKCKLLTDTPKKIGSASVLSDTNQQNSEINISNDKADSTCIENAPVLLTTNMSLAHCFMEKTKYLSHLRQKARQIASLKQKVTGLNKKIEELEDKCIVQERQLSFSFLKRLRTIRKNASKGDPSATYIFEQIRAYTGQKQMRWSDSTLQQCAVWCRKAPYAYEYFKKAEFFKLPCLGTVKRYMRKHPEITFTSKSVSNPGVDGDDSSSDFDFDEEDTMDEHNKEFIEETGETIACEAVLGEESSNSSQTQHASYQDHHKEESSIIANNNATEEHETGTEHSAQNDETGKVNEIDSYPVTVDGTNLEIQELILPSGEVVQCYSSNICNGGEPGNQYYIIPNAPDQNSSIDHEYSVVQTADSVPVILQNLESSQLHQEQLIFISNSTDQVECTETEIITAR